jgi:hypothetical protein
MIGIDNKFTLYKLSFSNGMFYYELSDAEDYDKLIRRQLSSSQHPVLALNLLYNSMNFMNVTVVAEHIITEFANCLLQAVIYKSRFNANMLNKTTEQLMEEQAKVVMMKAEQAAVKPEAERVVQTISNRRDYYRKVSEERKVKTPHKDILPLIEPILHKKQGPRRVKIVIIDGQIYDSIISASEKLNIPAPTINYRTTAKTFTNYAVADTMTEAIKISEEQKSTDNKHVIVNSKNRKCTIEGVDYDSLTEAAKALGLCVQVVMYRCNSKSKQWVNWTVHQKHSII